MNWRTLAEEGFSSDKVTLEQMQQYCRYRDAHELPFKRLQQKLKAIGYTGSIEALSHEDRTITDLEKFLKTGNSFSWHIRNRVISMMNIDDDVQAE